MKPQVPQGPCEFCRNLGNKIPGPDEGPESDIYVCKHCNELLKNPITAIPLIKGNVTLNSRGVGNERKMKRNIDSFIKAISKWRPVPPKN